MPTCASSARSLGVRDLGERGLEVETAARARCAAGGSWSAPTPGSTTCSAGLGVQVPLEVTLEQVTYFAAAEPARFAPGRLPLWIWMDDPSYYGFPCYGEPTVKAAQDCGGPVVDPDERVRRSPTRRCRHRLAEHMAAILPGSGTPVRSLRCQYTLTPDRDFVISPVPGPRVGRGRPRRRARLQVRADVRPAARRPGRRAARPTTDLTPFRLDRPALTDPDYQPTGWCDVTVHERQSSASRRARARGRPRSATHARSWARVTVR